MYCKVMILGRLGKDPELTVTKQGTKICRMSVATSKRWKNRDGQYEDKTEWHTVKTFGNTAENCVKYLRKGRMVFVEGELETTTWEKDGQKYSRTEILANGSGVRFVEPKDAFGRKEGGNLMDIQQDVPSEY